MNIVRLYKTSIRVFNDVILFLITYLPGPLGYKARYIYYKPRLKSLGKSVLIDTGVSFAGLGLISIGDNVHVDKNCLISTGLALQGRLYRKTISGSTVNEGEIIIGNNIHICPNCILVGYGGLIVGNNSTISAGSKLYSLTNISYNPNDRAEIISIMPYEQAPFLIGPIVLECNVWLGLNCTVMPGVLIKSNSFAVTNSVILKSFSSNSHIGGQPAVWIKNRFEKNENRSIFSV